MSEEIYKNWAPKLRDSLKSLGAAVAIVLLVVAGFWGSQFLASDDAASEEQASVDTEAAWPSTVTLTPVKREAAQIRAVGVAYRPLQAAKTVAATLDYNATRHLPLTAPVDCVVGELLVQPGQTVAEGDRLAVLSSAEVALARTEIKKSQADVRITRIQYDWTKATHDNLGELLVALQSKPPLAEIEARFDDASLGEHRDHLLTAYSEFALAKSVADRTQPLDERGLISGGLAEQRASQRDITGTQFKTACEQAKYESRRALARAEAELEAAEQQLGVSRERLRLLLGPTADEPASATPGDFEIRAAFSGRVEAISTTANARLAKGDPILTLADTSTLWVSALVHQHEWNALQQNHQTVRVSLPALPNRQFEAKVRFVGAEISPQTRAIELVAELDNGDGVLRPGMFAWVSVPLEPARQGLAVPPSAIQRHESNAFVFVQEAPDRFRREAVMTGIETPEYVEIVEGLSAGQMVVDRGAFYLKSELMLEQE